MGDPSLASGALDGLGSKVQTVRWTPEVKFDVSDGRRFAQLRSDFHVCDSFGLCCPGVVHQSAEHHWVELGHKESR